MLAVCFKYFLRKVLQVNTVASRCVIKIWILFVFTLKMHFLIGYYQKVIQYKQKYIGMGGKSSLQSLHLFHAGTIRSTGTLKKRFFSMQEPIYIYYSKDSAEKSYCWLVPFKVSYTTVLNDVH